MGKGNRSSRLFLRYAFNNVLLLTLPMLVAVIYFGVSSQTLGKVIDEFAENQLLQSINAVDREFGELKQMVAQLSEDYEVNVYLSSDGNFSDIEYYNLRNISDKLMPYVFGSPMISHLLLYLHRSETLISETGFGYYEDYYGTVYSFVGFNAAQWRDIFLLSPSYEAFTSTRLLENSGNLSVVRLYRNNIGYGDYYLGSLVGVISEEGLRGMLNRMPSRYGGWVEVADENGNLIVTTALPGGTKPDLRTIDGSIRSIEMGNQKLRLYRRTSLSNGWRYTAALNETVILSELDRMGSFALRLLSFGLIIGLGVAYFFAFSTTKPWKRLFDLVYQQQDSLMNPHKSRGAFQDLEQAIDILATRNLRMQAEVKSAEQITQSYYLQNTLRGSYRSRENFLREGREFSVRFAEGLLYVILVRIMPLNVLRGDEGYGRLRDPLIGAIKMVMDPGDFIVPISFDDVVLVRLLNEGDSARTDAVKVVEKIQGALEGALRGNFAFGIGEPVNDPFLLTLSYNQATAAVSSGDEHTLTRFYLDVPPSEVYYSYPLDVEEGLIRAIKSGNHDLVTTLLTSVRTENFDRRRLSGVELEYLFVELKGSVLKLFKNFPNQDTWPEEGFAQWWATPSGPAKFDTFVDLCHEVTGLFDGQKRSHNTVLLSSVQEYLQEHFADHSLSMTTLAEAFNRSENYVSSFYKEQTGERLSEAILGLRMKHAETLLLQGFVSIDDIAFQSGYSNTSSFRRAFKRYSGVSPSDFRDQNRK